MRTSIFFASCALIAVGAGLAAGSLSAGCAPLPPNTAVGGGQTGGSGGGTVGPRPGELCVDPTPDVLAIHFRIPSGTLLDATPPATCKQDKDCTVPDHACVAGTCSLLPTIFVTTCPAGQTGCPTSTVRVVVDPDTCAPSDVEFTTSDATIAPAPANLTVSLHNDLVAVPMQGGAKTGSAKITATVFAAQQAPVSCSADRDCAKTSSPTGTCHNGACTLAASASFFVDVAAPDLVQCMGTNSTPSLKGGYPALSLGGASISLPPGAANPNQGSFLWGVAPFPATIGCSNAMPPNGFQPLGPPITFGPVSLAFQREVPMTIPINPALLPSTASLRHVRVAYSGPSFLVPRVVPVADMHITQMMPTSGPAEWVLSFKAPRLGTYQAVIAPDAGAQSFSRRMTHRGVVGVSMGGGGTATFGMRHHNLFDVVAPLGGPVDWTWMLDYIANNQLGGFRAIAPGTQLQNIQLTSTPCMSGTDCKSDETCIGVIAMPATPGKCLLMPKPTDPYAHPQTFNTWWYEFPNKGTGGTFDRAAYSQIFRDLALMYGNPNSDNFAPGGENLPAGVPPTDPSVVGNHPGSECAVTLDPICPVGPDGNSPNTCSSLPLEQERANNCPAERCSHPLTLQHYFDKAYNPDGTFPVITICDGLPQNQALSPYANTWTPDSTCDTQKHLCTAPAPANPRSCQTDSDCKNNFPLEVGLAVDYNGNGVRDELEPVIRQGYEPWDDFGTDGMPSSMEPGYMPGVNDDPNGDDYNGQYNPSGTENDHRYQVGEKFYDVGIDGVANTPQQPPGGWQKPGDGYDVGEGDGKFTVVRGLQRFWDRDAYSIVRRMVDPANVPGGDLTDDALARVDLWTDGGLRDLFNFEVAAQHLVGGFAARGRLAGYLTSLTQAQGLDPSQPPISYDGKLVDWDALPGVVLQRYGEIDPSPTDIADGSGQHVGTAPEILGRLQAAIYYMGSRWRDRPELFMRVDTSNTVPGCSEGSNTVVFPAVGSPLGPSGRRGPVGISLPPGYCNPNLLDVRYPVIYVLHGYGQGPQDLEPVIVLLQPSMNSPSVSGANRLVKAILVYVDGRCRNDGDGVAIGADGGTPAPAECLRGTFFADSPRKTGAEDETWWLELMNYMDANYRTLGSTNVDWIE
jgi:hypothetical protein